MTSATTQIKKDGVDLIEMQTVYVDDKLVCDVDPANPAPSFNWYINNTDALHLTGPEFIIKSDLVGNVHNITCESSNAVNGETYFGYDNVIVIVEGK